jgi:hypothetical protein
MGETTPSPKVQSESTKPPKPLAAAAKAAAHLEIEQVRFLQFSALTGYSAFQELPERIQPKIGFTRPTFQVKDNLLCVTTTLLMRILPVEGPDTALPAFDLRATAELLYKIAEDSDTDSDALDEFARVNAPFNAWPFWREFVQSAFARLNLPASPLPLFRISDTAKLTVADEHTFGK